MLNYSIIDSNLVIVVKYAYTGYDDVTVTQNTLNLASINPFRYRGYYFDEDMKLYYLQSIDDRPRNRTLHQCRRRKLPCPETIHGLNLYAYCGNNPVSNVDPYGTAWFDKLWDNINTLAGFLNPVSKITALLSIVVAVFQGSWSDLESDWNNGCLNPFNQFESVALQSKILSFYKGSTVVRQNIFGTFSALGTIWLNQTGYGTLPHEYGHSIQERILGGAYWITIALPSVLYWFYDKQNRSDYDYYSTPLERSADWLGGVNRPSGYKPNSLVWSILENILGPIVIPFYFLFGF